MEMRWRSGTARLERRKKQRKNRKTAMTLMAKHPFTFTPICLMHWHTSQKINLIFVEGFV
jgi:hypothetical protein